MYVCMAYHVILQELFFTDKRRKEITDLSKLEYSDVITLSENREHLKNSGMLIVYWPITIKFRIRKQTSEPQINYRCCLRFSYLAPYWLISCNTITFHKYFWCSRFCEFHSKCLFSIINSPFLLRP